MNRTTWTACVILLGTALAAPVVAQSPEELMERASQAGVDVELLAQIRARAAEAGFDRETTASLLLPTVMLAERELPSRMMVRKTLEGLAKRVSPARIEALLERLGDRVEGAARIVDPWLAGDAGRSFRAPTGAEGRAVRSGLVESVALGLDRGASEPVVREILDRVPQAASERAIGAVELGAGIEIAADLPMADRDPGMAAQLVVSALGSGFDAAQMRELPAALRAAEQRGGLPAEMVARGAIVQFRELPAATVLGNLFQGEFPGNAPFDLPPGLENARGRGGPPPPPPPPE